MLGSIVFSLTGLILVNYLGYLKFPESPSVKIILRQAFYYLLSLVGIRFS